MSNPPPNIFLSPDDTLAVWNARAPLRPTVGWREMMHGEHAAAFTVAKIAKLDLLTAMQASLNRALEDGKTFESWKADILPELKRQGWWGIVQDKALTGTDDAIIVNDRRLRTIYRTNIRMSIAGGRWRKYQREKDLFPYIRYLSNHPRKRPRADHQSWHGIILRVDDPAWQWMFPPNGWGCNCRTEQVSQARMDRMGWKVSEAPNPPLVPFDLPGGGEIMIRDSVDPGFSYNPGTAHLRVLAERSIVSIERALAEGLDGPARQTLRAIIQDPAFEQFVALPNGNFPIAVLRPEQAQSMGVATRIATLSAQDQGKQIDRSRAGDAMRLMMSTYRPLANLFDDFIVMARDERGGLLFTMARDDGRILCVVVHRTMSGKGLFIKSARVQSAENAERFLAKAEILEDRRR